METVRVKLLMPHVRGGIALEPGTTVDIPVSKLDWYVRTGTAVKVGILTFGKQRSGADTDK